MPPQLTEPLVLLAPAVDGEEKEEAADDVAHVAEGVPIVQDVAPGMEALKVEVADVLPECSHSNTKQLSI